MKKTKIQLAEIRVDSFTTVAKDKIKGGAAVAQLSTCVPEDC